MIKKSVGIFAVLVLISAPLARAEKALVPPEYKVGTDDILGIAVLQPDPFSMEVTVTPDGYISFPYIGSVYVQDRTLAEIQGEVQKKLADGYLKYAVVSVALKISGSKKFFVYGEVSTPGAYPLDPNMTVFKAISVAGGLTKFGSSSKVKVLRPKKDGPGNEMIRVDIKAIMKGSNEADMLLRPGDVVIVSEGMF